MATHFLDLDAATVETASFRLAQRNARDAINANAMGLFYGDAGLGKTYAVESAIEQIGGQRCWLLAPQGMTPKALLLRLLRLTTGVTHEGTQTRLEPVLLEALSQPGLALWVDETQHLNHACVEYLRHLHDHPETQFSLLLVGGNGCYRLIQRHPMLASRVARWTKFRPLDITEVVAILPNFHALYRQTDPELLEQVDDRFAGGNLRRWANFTATARDLADRSGETRLTPVLVEAALHLIGETQHVA